MSNREEAKRYFTYYFGLIARKAGVNYDSDNDAEIEKAVDLIIDANKQEERARYMANGNKQI